MLIKIEFGEMPQKFNFIETLAKYTHGTLLRCCTKTGKFSHRIVTR